MRVCCERYGRYLDYLCLLLRRKVEKECRDLLWKMSKMLFLSDFPVRAYYKFAFITIYALLINSGIDLLNKMSFSYKYGPTKHRYFWIGWMKT